MKPSRLLSRLYQYMWSEILYPVPQAGPASGRAPMLAPDGLAEAESEDLLGEQFSVAGIRANEERDNSGNAR